MSKLVYGKILLLMALALLVACRKEKNSPSDVPAIRTVHYKASIQTGPDTRATVGNDLKYMFEAGDKVYMESADGKLYGFLSMVLPTGAGDNVALFEGDLTYAGDTPFPNDNPSVNLVLVSKEDAVHTVTDGRLNAVSYSSDTWAPTLEAAVSHMSHFTGYSKRNGTLICIFGGFLMDTIVINAIVLRILAGNQVVPIRFACKIIGVNIAIETGGRDGLFYIPHGRQGKGNGIHTRQRFQPFFPI